VTNILIIPNYFSVNSHNLRKISVVHPSYSLWNSFSPYPGSFPFMVPVSHTQSLNCGHCSTIQMIQKNWIIQNHVM